MPDQSRLTIALDPGNSARLNRSAAREGKPAAELAAAAVAEYVALDANTSPRSRQAYARPTAGTSRPTRRSRRFRPLECRQASMKVVWLRTALRNLDQSAAHIARDNVDGAARVVERLRRATDRLVRYPESGRVGRFAGTRELIVPGLQFIVPYRVPRRRIEILRACMRRGAGPTGCHRADDWHQEDPPPAYKPE